MLKKIIMARSLTFCEVFLKQHLPFYILVTFYQTPFLCVIIITLYFDNKLTYNVATKYPTI